MDKLSKGQPRSFKTDEAFRSKFIEYVGFCATKDKLPNIAGFCVFCDITRDTFYQQKEYYSDTYKKIQEVLEDVTINSKINDTFKIFYLKNKFGYRDKTEMDLGNKDDKPFNIDLAHFTLTELKELMKNEDKK